MLDRGREGVVETWLWESFRTTIALSDFAVEWGGLWGNSLSSLLFIRTGQKLASVAERLGRGRPVSVTVALATSSDTSSSGSSTMGCLVNHAEFDRVGVRGLVLDSAGGSATSAGLVFVSAIVSFLRMNHSPEPFPWTLIVSFLSASMSPKWTIQY